MRDIINTTDVKVPVHNHMTIRDAAEWWKNMVALDLRTGEESEYVNGRWRYIIEMIADREKVPATWLSYLVAELAYQEAHLMETAFAEGADSLITGDDDGDEA